ncbi:MAG: hypothetical protein AAGH87_02450 [Pseudomonadota bacterium]
MLMTAFKVVATAGFIVLVSEIAKRSTLLAALLVALPLATMMTVLLTYLDTRDAALSTRFATTTFYLVGPGLVFFILLPLIQRAGAPFLAAFAGATAATVAAYLALILVLRHFGIEL